MRKEVQNALFDIKTNRDIWLAIIDAEGDVFCAGKDLLEVVDPATDDGTVYSNDELFVYMRTVYKPIILALQGPCLAQGAGFALSSDIVLMTEKASIGWPQVKRGISSVSGPHAGCSRHALDGGNGCSSTRRGRFLPMRRTASASATKWSNKTRTS